MDTLVTILGTPGCISMGADVLMVHNMHTGPGSAWACICAGILTFLMQRSPPPPSIATHLSNKAEEAASPLILF